MKDFVLYWWENIQRGWNIGNNIIGFLQALLLIAVAFVWFATKKKNDAQWEANVLKVLGLLLAVLFVGCSFILAPYLESSEKRLSNGKAESKLAEVETKSAELEKQLALQRSLVLEYQLENNKLTLEFAKIDLSKKGVQRRGKALAIELIAFAKLWREDGERNYRDNPEAVVKGLTASYQRFGIEYRSKFYGRLKSLQQEADSHGLKLAIEPWTQGAAGADFSLLDHPTNPLGIEAIANALLVMSEAQ